MTQSKHRKVMIGTPCYDAIKRAVRAARTIDEIVSAGTIDWSDLVPET